MTVDLVDATIVIIEDDPNSYQATLDLLGMAGTRSVHICTSGEQALDLAESLPQIDLFLIDIYIPGETGFEILKRIRAHPKLTHSKAVALTASVMYEDIRRMKAANFDSFIGKPIRPTRFVDQVRKILAGEALWEWR